MIDLGAFRPHISKAGSDTPSSCDIGAELRVGMWLTASLAEADGEEEAGRTVRRHAMRRDAGWCPATWYKLELTRPRTALVGEPGEARARQAHRRLRLATPGPRRATSARARTSSISDGLASPEISASPAKVMAEGVGV